MKFCLLSFNELEDCKIIIESIDKYNILESDLDAIYKMAFHYLTTYHYCGRQKKHLEKAKMYFELPYNLNKENLHITALNIYKYLFEYDEAKSYCINWQIMEADYYKSKELYESIAHDSLLLFIKSSFNERRLFNHYNDSFNYLKLMIDNNYHIDNAIKYLIILYIFHQNEELYNYIFNICKKYNLEYLKIFAKYVEDDEKVLIEKELNNHNMTIHIEMDNDFNNLKLDNFEYYLIDDFVFEVNQIINKEYYSPRKFINAYEDSNNYEETYEFDSNIKETEFKIRGYTYFDEIYNSILYKLFLNIIIKNKNNYESFPMLMISIINYIYLERLITNEMYLTNDFSAQNKLFAEAEFDYDKLYMDILNLIIKDYKFESPKIYLLINNARNNNIEEIDNMSDIVINSFNIESSDLFEISLLMACNKYTFRKNLEIAACKYFWDNKYYDEYLIIYKYLLNLYKSYYDEVPAQIYYNIACYYLDSDEERFNLDLGIEYFNKYKELDLKWEENDKEANNLAKIIKKYSK